MCLGLAAALVLGALIKNIVIRGLVRLTALAFCAFDQSRNNKNGLVPYPLTLHLSWLLQRLLSCFFTLFAFSKGKQGLLSMLILSSLFP